MSGDGDTESRIEARQNFHTNWSPIERLLALGTATGLAITQPMLALFGDTPVLFTFNRVGGTTLIWISLTTALIPPLTLWAVGDLAGRRRETAGTIAHVATIGALLTVAAVQLIKFEAGLTNPVVVATLSIVVAAGITYSYVAYLIVAKVIRAMCVLPALAVVLFLFISDAGKLLTDRESVDAVNLASTDPARTPVVFLLLDELPTKSILDDSGGIDRDRFPNLAGFADGATWYRHFTTNATLTRRAAPSLLAGRDGTEDAALWTKYPDSIFSALAPTHDLVVFESVTKLCGYQSCTEPNPSGASGSDNPSSDLGRFVSQAFDLFSQRVSLTTPEVALDAFEEEFEVIADPEGLDPEDTTPPSLVGREGNPFWPLSLENTTGLPTRFGDFLAALEPRGRPGFYFIHLILPHQPWRYYEDGALYDTDEFSPDFPAVSRDNSNGPWVAALTEQRHLLQATYTDRLVGAFVEQLREQGLYDSALVIVAADHGISFELDTHIREPVAETVDSLAYAPLVIKYPGQAAPSIDDSNVMAIDLVPTIADVLEIETPPGVTGAAIGSAAHRERDGTKYVLDVADSFGQEIRGILEFEDDETFPDPTDRWIAPGAGPDALSVLAGMDHLLGVSLDSLGPRAGGDVTIDNLSRHEQPGDVPHAMVVGRTAAAETGTVVITVDGVIVAGSQLYEFNGSPGSFAALLPQDLITEDKTLGAALLDGDSVVELAVVR